MNYFVEKTRVEPLESDLNVDSLRDCKGSVLHICREQVSRTTDCRLRVSVRVIRR